MCVNADAARCRPSLRICLLKAPPIVFEGDVEWLMNVADPVSEKFQRCELLCLACVVG